MLSCQYGPKSLRNVSNTLLKVCHEEWRQFWRQKGVQPFTKVYLIKWPVSVYCCSLLLESFNLIFFLSKWNKTCLTYMEKNQMWVCSGQPNFWLDYHWIHDGFPGVCFLIETLTTKCIYYQEKAQQCKNLCSLLSWSWAHCCYGYCVFCKIIHWLHTSKEQNLAPAVFPALIKKN